MVRDDPMRDNGDCGGAAAAYALGALGPSEAADFREHLSTCIVCRDELVAFGEVTEALGMAAPEQAVPRGLRRRILREIRAEKKPAASQTQRRRSRSSRSRGLAARPGFALALLAGAALAVIGAVALAPHGLRAPRVIQAKVLGVAGSARLRIADTRARLIVSHLSAPASGRIYEVWIERKDQAPSPQALFNVSASGAAEVGVPGELRGASTIMVTQERAGGSVVPTRTPVIVASLG